MRLVWCQPETWLADATLKFSGQRDAATGSVPNNVHGSVPDQLISHGTLSRGLLLPKRLEIGRVTLDGSARNGKVSSPAR